MSITLTSAAIARILELQKNQPGIFYVGVKEKAGCHGNKYVTEMILKVNPKIHEEIKIGDIFICIDKKSLRYLKGMELDCINKSLGQWQWEFKNPNAKRHCGCGESFSVNEK